MFWLRQNELLLVKALAFLSEPILASKPRLVLELSRNSQESTWNFEPIFRTHLRISEMKSFKKTGSASSPEILSTDFSDFFFFSKKWKKNPEKLLEPSLLILVEKMIWYFWSKISLHLCNINIYKYNWDVKI